MALHLIPAGVTGDMRGVSPLITVFYPSFINGVNTLKKIWTKKFLKVEKRLNSGNKIFFIFCKTLRTL
jgi:hypothetical protein